MSEVPKRVRGWHARRRRPCYQGSNEDRLFLAALRVETRACQCVAEARGSVSRDLRLRYESATSSNLLQSEKCNEKDCFGDCYGSLWYPSNSTLPRYIEVPCRHRKSAQGLHPRHWTSREYIDSSVDYSPSMLVWFPFSYFPSNHKVLQIREKYCSANYCTSRSGRESADESISWSFNRFSDSAVILWAFFLSVFFLTLFCFFFLFSLMRAFLKYADLFSKFMTFFSFVNFLKLQSFKVFNFFKFVNFLNSWFVICYFFTFFPFIFLIHDFFIVVSWLSTIKHGMSFYFPSCKPTFNLQLGPDLLLS